MLDRNNCSRLLWTIQCFGQIVCTCNKLAFPLCRIIKGVVVNEDKQTTYEVNQNTLTEEKKISQYHDGSKAIYEIN